ncbi:MAG: type II toxin-antitoxin system VapC family toxin [Acidimicrobiaceae bacterium]|nr:type II toxin-antitoxin system VapC family toxin [Acidimicrobiaceae bacterium]
MIVLDASVIANFLGDDGPNGENARRAIPDSLEISVPDLADVETTASLRRRWIAKDIDDQRFSDALSILADLPFQRYPSSLFLQRAYELRFNVSAYDAMYVALAEALDCELLTTDARLANATGPRCTIRVLTS